MSEQEWQKFMAVGWGVWAAAMGGIFAAVAVLLGVLAAAGYPHWDVLWTVFTVVLMLSITRIMLRWINR